jgi:hypothetical protein
VYGAHWASAPDAASTLGAFALLLPLLAVNGVSEAYSAAAMTPVQLRASNSMLLVSTAVQSVTGIVASQHLGPAALLAGMAAGLLLRIVAALRFAVSADGKATESTVYFMRSLLPKHRCAHPLVLQTCSQSDGTPSTVYCRTAVVLAACGLTAAASNAALQAAPFSQRAALVHLAVGLGVALAAGLVALRWERGTLSAVQAAMRAEGKRKTRKRE